MLFKKNEIERVLTRKERFNGAKSNSTPQKQEAKTASNLYINST
jgi:hypothetical protein